jgi:hypothetical protein
LHVVGLRQQYPQLNVLLNIYVALKADLI